MNTLSNLFDLVKNLGNQVVWLKPYFLFEQTTEHGTTPVKIRVRQEGNLITWDALWLDMADIPDKTRTCVLEHCLRSNYQSDNSVVYAYDSSDNSVRLLYRAMIEENADILLSLHLKVCGVILKQVGSFTLIQDILERCSDK